MVSEQPDNRVSDYQASAREQKFFRELGAHATIESWSHNPWQPDDAPDAIATRIADEYIDRFTESLLDMGVMPFTGVEVNCVIHGEEEGDIVGFINQFTPAYYEHLALNIDGLGELVADIANAPLWIEGKDPNFDDEELITETEKLEQYIQDLRKNGYLTKGNIASMVSASQRLSEIAPISPILVELIDAYDRKHQAIMLELHDPSYGIGTGYKGSDADGFDGRVYKDSRDELEICTPALSPRDTVSSVNSIKRNLFQATYDYEAMYANSVSNGGESNPQLMDQAPRHPFAQVLRDHHNAFNLSYGLVNSNAGEHLSVSLQRVDEDDDKTYANAKYKTYGVSGNEKSMFGRDNLLKSDVWAALMESAYASFLPNDTMLALGNDLLLRQASSKKHTDGQQARHTFRHNGTDTSKRMEIRSFNEGSSNISLSMLSVMAITAAVVETIQDDPELYKRMIQFPAAIHPEDADTVLKRMKQKYCAHESVPSSVPEACDLLKQHSVTLSMMRQWVNKHMEDDQQKKEMSQEIDQFESSIYKRYNRILPDQVPEHLLADPAPEKKSWGSWLGF